MKQLITILTIAIFALIVQPVSAANDTVVRGNINDIAKGTWIKDLPVTVSCKGNSQTVNTNGNGLFEVFYTQEQCTRYNVPTVTVTYEGVTQVSSNMVAGDRNSQGLYTSTNNFSFNLPEVPEFGLITGALAMVGSMFGYRKLQKQS